MTDAQIALKQHLLALGAVDSSGRTGSTIRAQSPGPNTRARRGTAISVALGDVSSVMLVAVPKLDGVTVDSALTLLRARRLTMAAKHIRMPSLFDIYVVESQDIPPDSVVPIGTGVSVDIGPPSTLIAFVLIAFVSAGTLTYRRFIRPTPTVPIFAFVSNVDTGESHVAMDDTSAESFEQWHLKHPAFCIDADQNTDDTAISLIGEPAIETIDRAVS
jgi:hypothetical protein